MDAIVADEIGSEPSWRIYIGLRGATITLETTDQRQSASVTVPSASDMLLYRQSTLEPFPASRAARALHADGTDRRGGLTVSLSTCHCRRYCV